MKTILNTRHALAAMAAAVVLAACNKANPAIDQTPTAAQPADAQGLKIAYVEVDTLMSQYNFCRDYMAVLQKKSNNARNTITQKGKQLQAAVENFQQKLQNNGFTSREQAESVQATLQRQDQDLQQLQSRLAAELDAETAKYNDALRDSLQSFLADYNATKHYDLILSKAGDNILWADNALDITNDVVNGLNKRYKDNNKGESKK